MKKYIFVDIDGTLTTKNGNVSENNIEAIHDIERKNAEIVFCSGRCNNYLIDLSKYCQCSRYIISSNGSMVFDQNSKEIIAADKIPFYLLKGVYDYCYENKMALTFNTEEFSYCNQFVIIDKDNRIKKRIDSIEDISNKIVTQFIIGSYDYDKMIKVKNYLENIDSLEIVNISTTIKEKKIDSKDGFFYDVVLKGINKGTGIKKFITFLNIDKKDCIAIGDHVNDLKMFDEVNYKIAMGNAYDELKNKADFITKSNDNDGVKYALDYISKEILEKD